MNDKGGVWRIPSFKALLIDLDNTLMLFNEDEFLIKYAQLAAPYFSDLLDESTFFQKLLASTNKMLRNDGQVSNLQAFTDHFISDVPQLSNEGCYRRFDQYYQEQFQQIGDIINVVPYARILLQHVIAKGLQLVIATNPIFPERASLQRLKWANIADLDIAFITHAENMWYCKPRPEYYRAILEHLGRKPENCLMAGNDPVSDMAASTIGIKTFLIDLDQDKGRLGIFSKQLGRYKDGYDPEKFRIDGRGTLQDLEHFLLH